MNATVQPEAPTASPTINDQRVRLVLEAEIFQDPDGGSNSLIVTTDELACQPVVPARLLHMVVDARAQLDQIERMAKVYEAEDTIRAILAEHDLTLIEVDKVEIADFFGELAPRLRCWAGKDNRRMVVWVPRGQDPIERVNALVALVTDAASVVQA